METKRLLEDHDIDAYLTMFERMLVPFGRKHGRHLGKYLSIEGGPSADWEGTAGVYAAIAVKDSRDYDQLKSGIFQRYNTIYCVHFPVSDTCLEKLYMGMVSKVEDLATK